MLPRKCARSEVCTTPELSLLGPTKRRAVCSSPPPPPPQPQRAARPSLPLTHENLQAFEKSQKSSSGPDFFSINADQPPRQAMSHPSSPRQPNNNLDTSLELAAYQLLVNDGRELPAALNEHVSTVLLAPRNSDVPPSPNAAKIKQQN